MTYLPTVARLNECADQSLARNAATHASHANTGADDLAKERGNAGKPRPREDRSKLNRAVPVRLNPSLY